MSSCPVSRLHARSAAVHAIVAAEKMRMRPATLAAAQLQNPRSPVPMTAAVSVSWTHTRRGTEWCYAEARRCSAAFRQGGLTDASAVLTTDVSNLLVRPRAAHVETPVQVLRTQHFVSRHMLRLRQGTAARTCLRAAWLSSS